MNSQAKFNNAIKEKKLDNTLGALKEQREFLTPQQALKIHSKSLSYLEKSEILDFKEIYYVSNIISKQNQQKSSAYDDDKGDYRIIQNDHIAYRYEILSILGKGSFGVVLKVLDHKTKQLVALKILKNCQNYYNQAIVEENLLKYFHDHKLTLNNIVKMQNSFWFRNHMCIVFEMLGQNLYTYLKLNKFQGMPIALVRNIAIQILQALQALKNCDIIHCDIKPENILFTDSQKRSIKLIDFGSSCFQSKQIYTYIQSRFYRAPEIILGVRYTTAIDMWSLGCLICELIKGSPIFPGANENDQLQRIAEIRGPPCIDIILQGKRSGLFYDENLHPILINTKSRIPNRQSIASVLKLTDSRIIDFIEKCLD